MNPQARIAHLHPDLVLDLGGTFYTVRELAEQWGTLRTPLLQSWSRIDGDHQYRRVLAVEPSPAPARWYAYDYSNGHDTVTVPLAAGVEILAERGPVTPGGQAELLRGWDYIQKSSRYELQPRQYRCTRVQPHPVPPEHTYDIQLESGDNILITGHKAYDLDHFGIYYAGGLRP